jgi:hypothetical protein
VKAMHGFKTWKNASSPSIYFTRFDDSCHMKYEL